MDIRRKKEVEKNVEKIMRALIKLLKTQVAVAKALGVSKELFNSWYNNRATKGVPYDRYLDMKELLEKLSPAQPSTSVVKRLPLTLYQDERFLKAWRDFQHLPLHILFNALVLRCDGEARFPWQPSQLKTDIALVLEYDMEESLGALCLCDLIQKVKIDQCTYGVILCPNFFL